MSAMGSQDSSPDLLTKSSSSEHGTSVSTSDSGASMLGSALTVDQAWELVLEHILSLTRATGAAIALRERGVFVCKASAGEAPPVGTLANHDEGLVAECIRTGQTVISADTRRDPRVDPDVSQLLKLGSVVVIPLFTNKRVDGLISVSSPHAFAFDEGSLEGLTAIAGAIESILADAMNEAPSPAVEPSVPTAPSSITPPSSKPFASAFVRALEDSSNGDGHKTKESSGQVTSDAASVTTAEMFAAAGTLRAETDSESTDFDPDLGDVPSNLPVLAGPGALSLEAMATSPGLPEQPENDTILAEALDPVPVTQAVESTRPSAVPTGRPAMRAEANLNTLANALPVSDLTATPRQWTRPLIALAIVSLAVVSAVVWRSRAAHDLPASTSAAQVAEPPHRDALSSQSITPTAPTSAAEHLDKPSNAVTDKQNIVRPAALSESSGSINPTPPAPTAPASPQPILEQPTQKAIALPPPSSPVSKPVDEIAAPPPLATSTTTRPASALNSLVVPAVSAVPVLSPRIDASSVMLALQHDPKSVFNAAKLVTQNLPTYPEAARTAKKQGSVVLQATISPSGHVSQVRVMDGDSSLSAAATTAVQSWLFDPARLDGRPVESTVLVTMNFRLSQ